MLTELVTNSGFGKFYKGGRLRRRIADCQPHLLDFRDPEKLPKNLRRTSIVELPEGVKRHNQTLFEKHGLYVLANTQENVK